jgi:Domain of unknown function (DUF4365)
MARKTFGLRKRRTRQHVIADLSVNHVERFIIREGHTAQRVDKDYGYDLLLFTYDDNGFCEPDFLLLQLKAAEAWQSIGADYFFDLEVRDYNLWKLESMPVILILFDASRNRAFWLCIQRYFNEDTARQPKKDAKTLRVRVPMTQVVNRRAIAKMRHLKKDVRHRRIGGGS